MAPGNTKRSFEAALEHGVDMIEFDVLRTRDGRLVLAHDYEDAESRECLTLNEGLDHFAGEAYAGVQGDAGTDVGGLYRTLNGGTAWHRLVQVGGAVRIAWKRVDLVNCDAPMDGLTQPF